MIELFEKSGLSSLGSRLRWLSDFVTCDASEIYKLYDIDIKPKWFPVLYMLLYGDDNSVTAIAKAIGQTHPSVSNIAKEMKAAGLITDGKGDTDRRATLLCLTDKGKALKQSLKKVCEDVETVVSSIDALSDHRLWDAMSHWESMLAEKSLLQRVIEQKKHRDSRVVEIVEYRPEHLMTYKRLNVMWINSYWSLEPHDLEVLGDPQGSILSKGGFIFVALIDGCPMGVVALCPMDHPDYDYELAKLAVDPASRGSGIGESLCRAAIVKAKEHGARKIFLESNTILKPAINLYNKLGFTKLKEYHPAYERGDIQMELTIK